MAHTFAGYNFRIGMLSVSNRGPITVSAPIISKAKDLRLIIKKCHIKSRTGRQSTFIPSINNVFELKAGAMERFSFSFAASEISSYGDGTKMEIVILNETDKIELTVNYEYSGSTGWSLKEIIDVPYLTNEPDKEVLDDMLDDDPILRDFLQEFTKYLPEEPEEEMSDDDLSIEDLLLDFEENENEGFDDDADEESSDKSDLMKMDIDRLGLSVRAYNCLKRAGIKTVADLVDKTLDDMMKVRNLGRKALDEVLLKIEERGLKLKSSSDSEEANYDEGDFVNKEASIDWDVLSPVDRIKLKTCLDELGSKELEGFCCHYCTKNGNDNGYILIEQINVDLAEFIEDEYVWEEFQKVVFRDFQFRKKISGTIYVIFLINKNNSAVPIQKIEGYRKHGRKYVFTEPEAINFISGMNYAFKLDKNLNPVELWVNELKPINLTGIITTPYLSRHVEDYLDGEDFDDSSLFYRHKRSSGDSTAVTAVKKISSVEMGDFRKFCFGSLNKIEFGDINLFYGANGSGKTSILEALEYGFTAEIHRMKDFKIKYGNERYPRIRVLDNDGLPSVYTPVTSKKNSKEIERIWYGVPAGRTKTTLNEQFNRFNYFDSEAAYKFIHAKDQNDEAFEILFSNLLFGEQIVGYEKKWKRYKQSFDDAYSRIREELNSAEFWIGVYKDSLSRTTGGDIDVSSVYNEAKRLFLMDLHSEQDAALDRLRAIKEDLDTIMPTVEKFKSNINFEPGMSFSLIKRVLAERKAENEKLQETIEGLRNEITSLTNKRNTYIDKIQTSKAKETVMDTRLKEMGDAYSQYCCFQAIIEHPEQVKRLEEYEKELTEVTRDEKMIRLAKSSSSIQYLLSVPDISLLGQKEKQSLVTELSGIQEQLLSLKEEYRKVQEKSNQRKKDTLRLQKEGISFLQKYGTPTCPLCGERYGSLDELREHLEKTKDEEIDNTLLLSRISRLEEEVAEHQERIRHDDKLQNAYKEFDRFHFPDDAFGNERKTVFIKTLCNRETETVQRKSELETLIIEMADQGIDQASIAQAIAFVEHNKMYLRYKDYGFKGSFKQYYIERTKKLSEIKEQIKEEQEETRNVVQSIEMQIDSKQRSMNSAQTSDAQSRYINVRNLYQMLLPIKATFSVPDTSDLHQWVIDYETFTQTVNQCIDKISSDSNVEFEKQQAREYQRQAKQLRYKQQRCERAVNALNRMPSLKTFVTDTVQANIQRISYFFRWMHHSGEFESLGIDDVGVYAIRGVDNRQVRVYEMSTGQRTSLAFSVMLAFYSVADSAPKCLLLDEPLATMDNVQAANALDILKSLADEETQIFFTSASLDTIKLFQSYFRNSSFDYREFEFVKRINGTVKINNNQFVPESGDDTHDEQDVEAMYTRYEHSIADIIRMYPDTLSTKARLQGILKDVFPGETVRINLLLQAYEQGILSEIESEPIIRSPFAYKFKKRLLDNYGISNEYADWTVTVWCIAYGNLVLRKTCEIKNPVTHI